MLNKKNERGEYVFAGKSDKQLIQSEGGTGPVVEGSIDKLWTPWSIFLVRSALFLSYFFCFLPFIGIGSFLILFDLFDKEPLRFRVSDFVNIDSLLRKLKNPQNALSKHLYEQLSPDTHELVNRHVPHDRPSDKLLEALTNDLNKGLESQLLYKEKEFADVQLSERTRKFEKHLHINLNRKFLEDAYQSEISPSAVN